MQVTKVAPTIPAPPAPPTAPTLINVPMSEVQPRPVTEADVDALKAKRTELSRQLTSVQSRRDEVARALVKSPDGPARTGIEQRLLVMDQRIAQLETDIASNGRQLAAAPGALIATTEADNAASRNGGKLGSGQITAISIVFTLAVLAPIAIAVARSIFRRSTIPKPSPQLMENAARLERMEQAVDSIAIEIERVSEGQRFVTQLLSKRTDQPALGEGVAPAQAIIVPQPEQNSFTPR